MLNPMIRYEPGISVRYHGSLTDLHGGIYAAHPCTCLRCVDHQGLPTTGFTLRTEDGTTVATCVRPRSITPN